MHLASILNNDAVDEQVWVVIRGENQSSVISDKDTPESILRYSSVHQDWLSDTDVGTSRW